MSTFQTEQEAFWAGEFGNDYTRRNRGERIYAANLALFSRVFARTQGVGSIIELGANIGLNLKAIKSLLPVAEISAIEINKSALEELEAWGGVTVYNQSILDFVPKSVWDMVLSKGVLIHINPESLPQVYDTLYQSAQRYICIAEYYNTTPVEVTYRGHKERLFKRDFAGEMLDRFSDLRLLDYGFVYHRDSNFAQDDITWFLLEKV